MAEKPPAWSRSDGQIGQVPILLSQDVDESGVDPTSKQSASTLADNIVRQNQPAINRFVAKQRQAIQLGDKSVHNAIVPLPFMEVYYNNVQGLERMHYHISPIAEPSATPEIPVAQVQAPTPEAEPPAEPIPPILPEVPEVPEEAKEEPAQPGSPEFLSQQIPFGLAVEFLDGVQ